MTKSEDSSTTNPPRPMNHGNMDPEGGRTVNEIGFEETLTFAAVKAAMTCIRVSPLVGCGKLAWPENIVAP